MKKHLLLISLIICISFSLNAQIIHVPADHATVQAGINAASDGDTVLVAEGTYFENIRFMGKAITLTSEFILDLDTTHISNTIIDGSQPADTDQASVVMFMDGEDTTSILNGFTITGGTGSYEGNLQGRVGGGVFSRNSSCKVLNNIIINNQVEHDRIAAGGGIICYQSEGENLCIIENNKFIQNTVNSISYISYGGGIQANTNVIVKNNYIVGNTCINTTQEASGGGMNIYNDFSENGTAIIVGNIIRNNTLSARTQAGGGGFYMDRFSKNVEIEDNTIEENSVICEGNAYGGGIYLYEISNCSISNNTIEGNICEAASGRGGGIYSQQSGDLNIAENILSNNAMKCSNSWFGIGMWISRSQGDISVLGNSIVNNLGPGATSGNKMGGGIVLFENGERKILLDGNIIQGHNAWSGAGIFSIHSFNMILSNNLIVNNHAQSEGGGIKLQQNDYFGTGIEDRNVLVNNTFIQNDAPEGGAIFTAHEKTPIIINSLFWENTGFRGEDIYNLHNNSIAVYNNNIDTNEINGSWTGNENINDNPSMLLDKIHLTSRSICIDAGIDSLVFEGITYYCPAIDIDGDERPSSGTLPDIGADEYTGMVGKADEYLSNQGSLSIYPNPVQGSAKISYSLPQSSTVRIEILNVTGQKIEKLLDEFQTVGDYEINLNDSDLSPGLYFCVITTTQGTDKTKFIKLQY